MSIYPRNYGPLISGEKLQKIRHLSSENFSGKDFKSSLKKKRLLPLFKKTDSLTPFPSIKSSQKQYLNKLATSKPNQIKTPIIRRLPSSFYNLFNINENTELIERSLSNNEKALEEFQKKISHEIRNNEIPPDQSAIERNFEHSNTVEIEPLQPPPEINKRNTIALTFVDNKAPNIDRIIEECHKLQIESKTFKERSLKSLSAVEKDFKALSKKQPIKRLTRREKQQIESRYLLLNKP